MMPQSREHLDILSLLGIPSGVVALTKCDLVDEEWLGLVRADVTAALAASPLAGAPVIEVSARTGRGIDDLKRALAAEMRQGRASNRNARDLFRMPVDRAFVINGTGTVVTGTVWSGTISVDERVVIHPGGKVARVRGVQSHGNSVREASAGQRAAVALAGCNVEDVGRGTTLVTAPHWAGTRELDAEVALLDESDSGARRFRFHLGTSETTARIARVNREVESGRLVLRLRLDDPVIARGGDRFILRRLSPPATVGGGEILDSHPARRRYALHRSAEELIEKSGTAGVDVRMLAIRCGTEAIPDGCTVIDGVAYSADVVEGAEKETEAFVRAEIGNHSLAMGVPLHAVRAAWKVAKPVGEAALETLVRKSRLIVDGSVVRPADWHAGLTDAERALHDALLHEICVVPSEPPSVDELVAKHGSRVRPMLRRLLAEHELEKVSEDRYYGAGAVSGMIELLHDSLEPGRIYTPAELRDVLGVTRKYLIPFLEFCDGKGVTERVEQGRMLASRGRASPA
jgi:selenocysteine-specific elongation factor